MLNKSIVMWGPEFMIFFSHHTCHVMARWFCQWALKGNAPRVAALATFYVRDGANLYMFQYPPTPRARGSAPRRLDSHFVLVAFECFGPVPPRDIANGFACWRGISRAIELLFFMDSKGNVRRVFWLVFCMPWARILLAFRCFGTVPPRGICQWFC